LREARSLQISLQRHALLVTFPANVVPSNIIDALKQKPLHWKRSVPRARFEAAPAKDSFQAVKIKIVYMHWVDYPPWILVEKLL
jgi:hypothetical protein